MDNKPFRSAGRRQRPSVRTAKVGHKKTRTGCLTCRLRKVKCDEAIPECYNCSRLRLHCTYPKRPDKPGPICQPKLQYSDSHSSPESTVLPQPPRQCSSSDGSMDVFSETMPVQDHTALRLLHFWMSKAFKQYNIAILSEWRRIWFCEIPSLALNHDYLLYALLSVSATQMTGLFGSDPEIEYARFKYWSMALSAQQSMIARNSLSDIEPVTFAALLIAINAFSMLRDRDIEPYVPPTDWLEVSKGFDDVCPNRANIKADTSLAKIIDVTSPIWKAEKAPIDPVYQPILNQYSIEDTYGDMHAYETTLSMISAFRTAVQTDEPGYFHVRRVTIFAQLVPRSFIKFLQEQRPRALVVLASFFVVVSHSDALPYFGDANCEIPRREVMSIAKIVPEQWQGFMKQLVSEVLDCQ